MAGMNYSIPPPHVSLALDIYQNNSWCRFMDWKSIKFSHWLSVSWSQCVKNENLVRPSTILSLHEHKTFFNRMWAWLFWLVILTHVLDCFYKACDFWFENRFLKSHIYYTYNGVLEDSQCNFFCISKCCSNQKEFHYKKEKMIIAKWYLHKIRLLIILIDVFFASITDLHWVVE